MIKPKPNEHQVGGKHYKTAYEHWDMVLDTGAGYLEGQATKYLARWRKKNGVQDLEKAFHYVDKMLERGEAAAMARGHPGQARIAESLERFFEINGTPFEEREIFNLLIGWYSGLQLEDARARIAALLELARAEGVSPRNTVFTRTECTFRYCPNPSICQQQCQSPLNEAKPVPLEDSNKHGERA